TITITDISIRVKRMVEIISIMDAIAGARAAEARGIQGAVDSGSGKVLGTVTAAVADIRMPFAGTVAEVLVKDGQAVKKGEVLARLGKRNGETPPTVVEMAERETMDLRSPFDGQVMLVN